MRYVAAILSASLVAGGVAEWPAHADCGLDRPSGAVSPEGSSADSAPGRPVLVPQLGHAGAVALAALSPDGRFVVTGGRDGTVRLWHAETGHELRRLLEPSSSPIQHVVADFSPDDKRVVFASREALEVLDLGQNKVLWQSASATSVMPRFSPDGEMVQVCQGVMDPQREGQTAIVLLAAETGEIRDSIAIPDRAFGGRGSLVYAWSPDRRLAAVGFHGPTEATSIGVWDLVERRLVDRRDGFAVAVRSLRFSPSGRRLLALDAGHRLHVWERFSLRVPEAIAADVVDAAFLREDGELAIILQSSADWSGQWGSIKQFDSRLVRWNLQAARATAEVPYSSSLPGMPMSFSNGVLLTGYNTSVDLWSPGSWQRVGRLSISDLGKITAIHVSDEERFLLVVFEGDPRSPRGFLVDLVRGEVIRETRVDEGSRFALDGAGRYVIEGEGATDARSGEVDSLLYWDPLTSTRAWSWQPPGSGAGETAVGRAPLRTPIRLAAVSPSRDLVATAGGDGHVAQLWDGSTGALLHTLDQDGPARAVEFSADGRRLLSCGRDARVWDVPAGRLWRHFRNGLVTSARFAHRGGAVVLTLVKGKVVLWDPAGRRRHGRMSAEKRARTSQVDAGREG